jgi:hypothetical protein
MISLAVYKKNQRILFPLEVEILSLDVTPSAVKIKIKNGLTLFRNNIYALKAQEILIEHEEKQFRLKLFPRQNWIRGSYLFFNKKGGVSNVF